jgi:hypothetical protein
MAYGNGMDVIFKNIESFYPAAVALAVSEPFSQRVIKILSSLMGIMLQS